MYYVLAQLLDSGDTQPEQLPFTTRSVGLSMALQSFEEVLEVEADLEDKIGAGEKDELDALQALQTFRSGSLKLLLSETAMAICLEIGDNTLLWKWVQMSKAQAYSA